MSDDEQLFRRPGTRAECWRGPRPCPWVACKFHLADPSHHRQSGGLRLSVLDPHDLLPDRATPEEVEAWTERAAEAVVSMEESCSLDVIDREPDGATLEQIGQVLQVSRERIRQIERATLPTARQAVRKKLHLRTMREDS